jgi:hypothetical protein
MRRVLSTTLAIAIAFAGAGLCPFPARAADSPAAVPTIKELEAELTGIERELSALQQKVDVLLQDLVDPRITSVAVFFTSESVKDRAPLALEVLLNGRPLATRDFSETDRLVLIKGGSMEIHTGIIDARSQTLTFRCTVGTGRPGETGNEMAASTFALDPVRATRNYVEVSLSRGADPKVASFVLTAKTWARE